jgi:hypothetical protein
VRLRGAPLIGLTQDGVESLGEKAVQQRLPLLRRKLPGQLPDLLDGDGDRQRCHDKLILSRPG